METIAKPLQWMEDYTVSTNQLRAAVAARTITKSVVSTEVSESTTNDESSNGYSTTGENHLNDSELTEKSAQHPEVQNYGQTLFGIDIKVATNNDEETSIKTTHKPNRKIKSRKLKKPINLWELGKGTHNDTRTAHENLQSYYKILNNQKVPPPSPNDTVNASSLSWPPPQSTEQRQPTSGNSSSTVKLPPINSTMGSQVATNTVNVVPRHNTTQASQKQKVQSQPYKGSFLSFKPLTTSQRYNATSTLGVHRNKLSPRKPIERLQSFSGLEVAPTNGTALAYTKAMITIQYEKEENITANGLIKNKFHYPFRLSEKSPSPFLYRNGQNAVEEEKMPLNEVNSNILEQVLTRKDSHESFTEISSDLIMTSDENNQQFRQYHKRASIIDSFSKVSDEYLVRYDVDDKMKALVHKLRGGITNSLDNLTDEIRSEYDDFMTEIDQVSYYNLRQAEALLTGYTPLSVVLISSTIPRTDLLCGACKPEVLSIIYDAGSETYESLIEKIKGALNDYRKGAKIRYLAIVCKGGPGYMYLLKKNPITPPKLLKDKDLLRFWRDLGSCMSKISNEPSVVHLMESNVAGNKQGEMLLQDLEATIFAHKVKIESPLEISAQG